MSHLPVTRIVVGTDFSPGSDAAFAHALALAEAFHAALDIVHVIDSGAVTSPVFLGALTMVDADSIFTSIDDALTKRSERAAAAGVVCQTNSLDGFPAKELVRHAAKTGADLIVVGTHGRTGLEHVLLGSVAERVVQRSACPVLVVPQK
ncbi:MAG TPA: universal stress protein [Polyangia bacterium]|nr:universal stress protein [Polyangia bacterium]